MPSDPEDRTLQGDEEDAAAIRRLYRDWIAAGRSGDVEALLGMVTEDALFLSPGAPAMRGKEALESAYRIAFSRHRIEQGFDEEELVLAGEWAFCRGRERFTATPYDGGPPVSMSGRRALSILRKGPDGVWRFARGISNDGPKAG